MVKNNIKAKPQLITIFLVTSVYNGGERLKKTLGSVAAQTNCNFVHYIYDDGSPCPSDEIIKNYCQQVKKRTHPYEVIYEKGFPNIGVDAAHRHCFQKCSGTHICWLDQGDTLDPHFIEILTKDIQKHSDCTWFHINSVSQDLQGEVSKKPDSASFHIKNLSQKDQKPFVYSGHDFFYHLFVVNFSALIAHNPSLLIEDGHQNGGFFYDAQIALIMATANEKMFFEKRALTQILIDPKSVATSFQWDPQKMRQAAIRILTTLNFPKTDVTFYQDFQKFVEDSLSLKTLALSHQKMKAKITWTNLRSFMKAHNFPSYYFVYRKRAHFFYRCSQDPLLLAFYRRLKP